MKQTHIKHYAIDDATNASLWVCQCGWEKCKPSHSFGPATRDHFLMHYVVDGSGVFKNSYGEYHLKRGQGFLIFPKETTIYHASNETPWEYYWVGFKGVDAEHILEKCGISQKNPIFTSDNIVECKRNFVKMFQAFKSSKNREYAMLAYLYLIMSDLISQNKQQIVPSANVKVYLNSAVAYINDNYSYDINVKKLADYIGIDRTYLYRIFMDNMHISPEQYILKVRMTKAANQLKDTDHSVLQVALSSGYKDISHFSHIFKKYFKISPTAYRK